MGLRTTIRHSKLHCRHRLLLAADEKATNTLLLRPLFRPDISRVLLKVEYVNTLNFLIFSARPSYGTLNSIHFGLIWLNCDKSPIRDSLMAKKSKNVQFYTWKHKLTISDFYTDLDQFNCGHSILIDELYASASLEHE